MSSAEIAERISALKLELQDYSQKIGKKSSNYQTVSNQRLITSHLISSHVAHLTNSDTCGGSSFTQYIKDSS